MNFRGSMLALPLIMSFGMSSNAFSVTAKHPLMASTYPMTIGAGEYQIENYNRSELQGRYLDLFAKNQAADRNLVLQKIGDIESAFNIFINEVVNGQNGIIARSEDVLRTDKASGEAHTKFFGIVRKFKTAKMEIENALATLDALPSTLSENAMKDTNGSNTRKALKVDFSEITEHYRLQLDEIVEQILMIEFKVDLGDEYGVQIVTIDEIDDLKEKIQINRHDLSKMRRNAKKLRREYKKIISKDIMGGYNGFFNQKVGVYIDTFGTSQRYKSQQNADGLKMAMKSMEDAFWTRSYLRAVFGIGLGSFGLKWEKRYFNLDWLNSTELTFKGTIRSKLKLEKEYDNLVNAIAAMEKKSGVEVEGELNITSKIASTFTFIAGKSQLAQANLFMLKLLALDIKEEMMLANLGGRKQVYSLYQTRYKSTEEDAEYYANLKDMMNGVTFHEESDDVFADVTTGGTDSIRDVFTNAVYALEEAQDALDRADDLDSQLNELRENSGKRNNSRRAADML